MALYWERLRTNPPTLVYDKVLFSVDNCNVNLIDLFVTAVHSNSLVCDSLFVFLRSDSVLNAACASVVSQDVRPFSTRAYVYYHNF